MSNVMANDPGFGFIYRHQQAAPVYSEDCVSAFWVIDDFGDLVRVDIFDVWASFNTREAH